MAIQFLHDINLNDNELQNVKLHVTGTAPTAAAGAIYYDSNANVVKVHNGTSFQTLSTDTSDDNTQNVFTSSFVDSSSDAILRLTKSGASSGTQDIKFVAGSNITLTPNAGEDELLISSANDQLTTEQVQDIVGAMFSSNTETRISASYVDGAEGAGKINLVVDDMTANDNTQNTTTLSFVDSSDDIILRNTTGGAGSGTQDITINAGSNITLTHTDANNITIASAGNTDTLQSVANSTSSAENFVTFVASASGAQTAGSDSTFVYIPSTETLKVKNLIVSGDTTTASETVKIVSNNTLEFEGAAGTDADNELKLTTAVLTGDHVVTLPNATGTVALTSDITGTNSGTNTGDEPAASTTVAGIIELATNTEANAGSATNRAVTPANLGAFTGTSNIATVGTISNGTWEGTAISTDYIANTSGTNTGDEPDASTSTKGIIEIATQAEVKTGTDTGRAVTPATLRVPFKAVTITGNGTLTDFNVDHSFDLTDLLDVNVQVVDSLSSSDTYGQTIYASVDRTTKDRVVVSFGSPPANNHTYKVHCIQMGV